MKLDVEYKKIVLGIGLGTGIINIMNREDDKDLKYHNVNIRFYAGYRF